MKCVVIIWDWKEQIPTPRLQKALTDVFDGTNCPHVTEIEGGIDDSFAMVVTPNPISEGSARRAFTIWDATGEMRESAFDLEI